MQKLFASSLVLASLVFAQEPSAFNAGGTVPPKTELQIIDEKLFNLSTQVKNIEESQEGLKSVFEGQIQRVQDVASKIELLKGENNATIADVRKHTDSNFALQNENIEKIKQSISSLGALIKKTNAQMQEEINVLKEKIVALESLQSAKLQSVSPNSLNPTKEINATNNEASAAIDALVANVESNATQVKVGQSTLNAKSIEELPLEKNAETENTQKIVEQTALSQANDNAKVAANEKEINDKKNQKVESKTKDSSQTKKESQKTSDLSKKPLASVFQEGEQFYKDKNYGLADEYLQFAVKGNYKPARGNYLLGEIAFEQKRYEDAIYYYKTSATRYDKADYMPRLMLNSAKSFLSLKENEHANRFLETLITLYPKSNEAKEAKKLIK